MRNKYIPVISTAAAFFGILAVIVGMASGAFAPNQRAVSDQTLSVPVGTWQLVCENGTTPQVDGLTVTCEEIPTATATDTDTPTPTDTPTSTPTLTATISPTPGNTQPFVDAPLCPDSGEAHDLDKFHTLWDSTRGCHYDHEHGTNPFTADVAAAFPGFDLPVLLGGHVQHSNPSSAMEFPHKGGGFKIDVLLNNPHPCVAGFENAQRGVRRAVIGYHAFGDYSIEMEARIHSSWVLVETCDGGRFFTIAHQDYGQRVTPYQNFIIPYPNSPSPAYPSPRGPYFTMDCVYSSLPGCRTDPAQILNRGLNTASKWSSKPTGEGVSVPRNPLFLLLFNVRDTYQVFDSRDQSYPFTFTWVCSSNNGSTYNPTRCRYNNTATSVDEVTGTIPAAWDNLAGFDTNPIVGRVTAFGYTDRWGVLQPSCTEAGTNCFPVKLDNMPVGTWGDYLGTEKTSNLTPANTPERDIYFCNGSPCAETSAGAVPSGWVGTEN